MQAKIKIEGAKELHDLLAKLPAKVEGQFMKQALRAGGAVIVRGARRNLKARGMYRTGVLSKSLGVVAKRTSGKKVAVSVKARQGGKYKYDGFYGRFLEFGTRDMPARPFLRPAVRLIPVVNAMADKFNKSLDKFIIKYGR